MPSDLPKFVPDSEVFPEPRGYTDAYELIASFNNAINLIFKAWQYHFEYLNLTYLAYLMFDDAARKLFPGIKESTIGKMVAGADVSMFRPEEELCRLSRLAMPRNPSLTYSGWITPAAEKIEKLKADRRGKGLARRTGAGQESLVLRLLRERLVSLRG